MTASSDDVRQVADALHNASIRLLRRLRKVDDGTGLSGPRLSALSVLVFRGEMSLGDLAAAEQVKPPTMTRLAAALEAEGLAERQANPVDARGVLLRATSAGKKLMQAGRERRVALLVEKVAALSPAKRKLLGEAAVLMVALAAQMEIAKNAGDGEPTNRLSGSIRRSGPADRSPRKPRRR